MAETCNKCGGPLICLRCAGSTACLTWTKIDFYEEAILGDFEGGDGVRFSLQYMATCYRRGPWKLLVEVAVGENHEKWGCFDDQDQPMRWYHNEQCARTEAQAIAHVLCNDRSKR